MAWRKNRRSNSSKRYYRKRIESNTDPEAKILLVHRYIGIVGHSGITSPRGSWQPSWSSEEKMTEAISISIQGARPYIFSRYVYSKYKETDDYFFNEDRFFLESGVNGREHFPVSDPEALNKIRDFLLRDSVKRVNDRRLPKDLINERLKK